jgi:hypothetical protein
MQAPRQQTYMQSRVLCLYPTRELDLREQENSVANPASDVSRDRL